MVIKEERGEERGTNDWHFHGTKCCNSVALVSVCLLAEIQLKFSIYYNGCRSITERIIQGEIFFRI